MDSNVLALPFSKPEDVPQKLRELAERIERGEFGTVHSVAWVADCGDMRVAVGLVGNSPLPGPEAHLMLAMGMRKLET